MGELVGAGGGLIVEEYSKRSMACCFIDIRFGV